MIAGTNARPATTEERDAVLDAACGTKREGYGDDWLVIVCPQRLVFTIGLIDLAIIHMPGDLGHNDRLQAYAHYPDRGWDVLTLETEDA